MFPARRINANPQPQFDPTLPVAHVHKVIPRGDLVVLTVDPTPTKTAGGLDLPDGVLPVYNVGAVIAAGRGRDITTRGAQTDDLKPGMRVIYMLGNGTPIGKDGLMLNESDIVAIIAP